ncbi:MAG: hypothetical protein HW421_1343 [Ignavibacteria bacterium]|nr:hypothetical protein [Ignavibacteria bacterium]
MLNFIHDVQLHEHHEEALSGLVNHRAIEHLHDIFTGCHHSESENQELPFKHCHLQQAHFNLQLKNSPTSSLISDISQTFETIYCYQPLENYLKEYIPKNEGNNYHPFIGLSLFLRAPPKIS